MFWAWGGVGGKRIVVQKTSVTRGVKQPFRALATWKSGVVVGCGCGCEERPRGSPPAHLLAQGGALVVVGVAALVVWRDVVVWFTSFSASSACLRVIIFTPAPSYQRGVSPLPIDRPASRRGVAQRQRPSVPRAELFEGQKPSSVGQKHDVNIWRITWSRYIQLCK